MTTSENPSLSKDFEKAGILGDFLLALQDLSTLDLTDWQYAIHFAERWKMSVADALLDLHFIEETPLAKALSKAHDIPYMPGAELECDFSGIDLEAFDDLVSVGAAPLAGFKLAVCNPYDDLRGNLGNKLCERDLVVTERGALFEILKKQALIDWQADQDENTPE